MGDEVVLDLPGADVAVALPDVEARVLLPERTEGGDSTHLRKKRSIVDERHAAKMYLSEKKVEIFVNILLVELLTEMPENPVQWCTQFFTRHDDFEALVEGYKEKVQKFLLTKEARVWAAEWNITKLMNDLLESILDERPAEPDAYAGTWFRWKKNTYKKQEIGSWEPK